MVQAIRIGRGWWPSADVETLTKSFLGSSILEWPKRKHLRWCSFNLPRKARPQLKREYLRTDLEVNQCGACAERKRNDVRFVHGPDITSADCS